MLRHTTRPIDLGHYDPAYAGWCVVLDLDVRHRSTRRVRGDDRAGPVVLRMLDYLLPRLLVSWNFVDEQGTPLPQPADGGLTRCPQALLRPIFQAFCDALRDERRRLP